MQEVVGNLYIFLLPLQNVFLVVGTISVLPGRAPWSVVPGTKGRYPCKYGGSPINRG